MRHCKSCFRYLENAEDAIAKGLVPRQEHGFGAYSRAPRSGIKTRCCCHTYTDVCDGNAVGCELHQFRWTWNLGIWWRWHFRYSIDRLWSKYVLCTIGKFRKPLPVEWEASYGGTAPICPRCKEMIYEATHCVFCGQRFVMDNALAKYTEPPEVKYMDCFECGGKGTLAYVESKVNGHKHGECSACGRRFI
ncbi:MAG: hypothetical protein J6M06_00980 [Synergistaceae bacterium]|nr:hypothetical protein [Synergistaceae bacterium]